MVCRKAAVKKLLWENQKTFWSEQLCAVGEIPVIPLKICGTVYIQNTRTNLICSLCDRHTFCSKYIYGVFGWVVIFEKTAARYGL
jgi:hypothetical protein